jgi:nucleoside-diphosphate-sugar epimerase
MLACVTGGTGFIGGPLVRRLLAEGVTVRVLARPSSRAKELEAIGAQVVSGDLGDGERIKKAVEGVDVVFHIAAKVNPPGTKAEFFETNAGGTERILQAALDRGARKVVYLSSISVYGLIGKGERIDETTGFDAAPELRDYYAASKIAADQFAVSFAKKTGFPVVIFRPGLIYGPGRPLPLGLLGFAVGKTNVVFGQPNHRVPLSYTENLLDAMQLLARLKAASLRQYIIVDDDELTLGQYHAVLGEIQKKHTMYFPAWPLRAGVPVAEALVRMLPLERSAGAVLRQVRRAMQDRWYVTKRLREESGWEPRVTLVEAVKATLRAGG